jgi:hypothetical protein
MRTDASSIGGVENLPCAAESPGRAPLHGSPADKTKPGFGIERIYVSTRIASSSMML